MVYVYPKLPAKYTGPFFRIAGNGLANCLFIYARAIAIAKRYNLPIISPTWFNLSIGPYLRNQVDKRHYLGLFNRHEEISGIKKALILLKYRHINENASFSPSDNSVIIVSGLGDFFVPILSQYLVVSDYLLKHINQSIFKRISTYDFSDCIAIHVRLGDYIAARRIPMDWYIEKIRLYKEKNPNSKFLLFSDGTDRELSSILAIPGVSRFFGGNALADIIAISRCCFVIGSDSTFSAWGVYLGQIPCVFYRLQSKPVLSDNTKEIIEND